MNNKVLPPVTGRRFVVVDGRDVQRVFLADGTHLDLDAESVASAKGDTAKILGLIKQAWDRREV